MSTETIRLVREEGQALYQALKSELYLNHSGQKSKTEITKILKSFRDLLEPEIFESLKSITSNTQEEGNGIRLMLEFLAETILLSKSSQIEDGILDLEASSIFTVGKTKVPFRASGKALLKKSKKQETQEIEEKRDNISSKLNQLYLRQYAYLQKDSHDLGFSSYLDLHEFTKDHSSVDLVEKAKEFIRDTEYISRDLLTWFALKRMDLKLKDVSTTDLFYLINSFELKELFPKLKTHSMAQAILDGMKINLPATIKFDSEKRKGHIIGSFPYISNPGVEMLISTNLIGSVSDHESFLGSFGECLSYGFTDRDDYFEFAYLREKSFLKIFAQLFKNLIFEPSWLNKHLKIDADNDFLKFLYLRRLLQIRVLSAKVIFEAGLYQRQEDKAEMYKEIMEIATHCEIDAKDYLFNIQPHLSSLDEFRATMSETDLRAFLIDNYDEQWWRNKKASDLLYKIWETGGRTSTKVISQEYELGDPDITNLLKTFEKFLG